jgi:hypothetical protein
MFYIPKISAAVLQFIKTYWLFAKMGSTFVAKWPWFKKIGLISIKYLCEPPTSSVNLDKLNIERTLILLEILLGVRNIRDSKGLSIPYNFIMVRVEKRKTPCKALRQCKLETFCYLS